MTVEDVIRNHTSKISLYGEAALAYANHFKEMPKSVLYKSDDVIQDSRFIFYQPDAEYILVSARSAMVMQWIDIVCYAFKTKNLDLFTDAVLTKREFYANTIRNRYYQLYRRYPTVDLDKYAKAIHSSSIATFLKQNHMTYTQFKSSIPSLCEVLNCDESKLNDAIEVLIT